MSFRPLFLLAALLACTVPALAAPVLTFQAIEPSTTSLAAQVFVADPSAVEQTDDRGLVNIAGYRRVRPEDDPNVALFTNDGVGMLLTLDKWRAASGTADITSSIDESKVVLAFRRLVAFGRYSIFTRTLGDNGPSYAPLDGKGELNSFTADVTGAASPTIFTPKPLVSGTQIVVIYHSDSTDYGVAPGQFGHTAHQQLILRVP